ncbi:hypothetical protein Z042_25985 [Chania multitudinisentens RB-25]|uniref:AB hydrolase-1 domain-containing protein n=1 Tax=Chania multitudinisentens RB-25 TaxID=1441930 RepID=A0A0D4ZXI9_9GAMM|nr:alpha/beta hydrolase [Chania multitudinisentens]AJW28927.1 hypothetical protein Z042_25985 [Chania multitudinisentens RB-25]
MKIGTERLLDGGYIAVRSGKIDPRRKTLVFLHGLAGSSSAWDRIAALGFSGFNTILLDLRGHGISHRYQAVDDYRIELIANDVIRVLRELHITQPIFVAHSFGCLIALTCVAQREFTSSKLILLSPGYPRPHSVLATVLDCLLKAAACIIRRTRVERQGGRVNYDKYPKNTDYNPRRMAADIHNTGGLVYLSCIRWALSADMTSLLSQLEGISVLLVHGKRDSVFPIRAAQKIKDRVRQSQLVTIDDGNHVLPLTHPEQLHAIITVFLAEEDFCEGVA